MPLQGKCLCSRVQIAVDDAALPLQFNNCYCLNCHTTAGSPSSTVAMADLDKVKVEGEAKSCECEQKERQEEDQRLTFSCFFFAL